MSVIHNDLPPREYDFRRQDLHTIEDNQLLPPKFNFNFFAHGAPRLFLCFGNHCRALGDLVKRIFFLSPAHSGGKRAALLTRPEANFELARQVQIGAASLGDVFAFCSGLYFRGKLAYARHFAGTSEGVSGVQIITPSRGLVPAETMIGSHDLFEFSRIPVDAKETRFTGPLMESVKAIPTFDSCEVILLGSVATGKYTDALLPVLGERLLFPADFAGRGDMSRGALLLRSVAANQELHYVPVPAHGRPRKRLIS
jgi:hypothetical protein